MIREIHRPYYGNQMTRKEDDDMVTMGAILIAFGVFMVIMGLKK